MQEIWNGIKEQLSSQVAQHAPSKAVLDQIQLLETQEPTEGSGSRLRLALPSPFALDMAERELRALIENEVRQSVTHSSLDLEFVLSRSPLPKAGASAQLELGAPEEPLSNNSFVRFRPHYGLDPEFHLESYIQGASNGFALDCVRQFLDPSGFSSSTLLIHGSSGVGKTHLINALGWAVLERHPETRIKYLPGEEFINEYHTAIRKKSMSDFRYRFRTTTDLLIIDDVQSLANAKKAQEELFNTINWFATTPRKIVFTCDRSPALISEFEGRLRSRLIGGLCAEIAPPDRDTRYAIAVQKTLQMGVVLSPDCLNFLCESFPEDLRALSGALLSVAVATKSFGKEPTLAQLRVQFGQSVEGDLGPHGSSVTIDQILAETSRRHHLNIADLKGPSRAQVVSKARKEAYARMKMELQLGYTEIGRIFNRDHSAVMKALRSGDRE